jgi:hypothetical protein
MRNKTLLLYEERNHGLRFEGPFPTRKHISRAVKLDGHFIQTFTLKEMRFAVRNILLCISTAQKKQCGVLIMHFSERRHQMPGHIPV